MNLNPPQDLKNVTYFVVPPQIFQAVVNKLTTLPYGEVAGVLQDFLNGSKAMFTPLPDPELKGPGGRVVRDPPTGETVKGNGADKPAGQTATLPGDIGETLEPAVKPITTAREQELADAILRQDAAEIAEQSVGGPDKKAPAAIETLPDPDEPIHDQDKVDEPGAEGAQ